MRAVILAAGKGERLGADVPKPMVEVGGVPVLWMTLRHLRQHGITDIVITVANQHAHDFIVDSEINYTIESSPLGTAGGFKNAMKWFPEGSGPVLVWNGDNLSTCNPQRMLKYHQESRSDCTIAVCWRDNADRSSVIGWLPSGRINTFYEKGQRRCNSGFISAGIYIIEPHCFEDLPDVGDFGHDVFPAMIVKNRYLYAYGFSYDESLRWYDTPEDLAKLREDYGALF